MSSPFGPIAYVVAAIAALGILAVWLVSLVGMVERSPELGAAALLIIGVIFGVGAGASTVSNGAGRQAAAANTRLDAIGAPAAADTTSHTVTTVTPAVGPASDLAPIADPDPTEAPDGLTPHG